MPGLRCHADVGPGGGAQCTVGTSISCQLNGCDGARQCLPDSSGYGPCTCGDAGSRDSGPGDAGLDSDITDTGDSVMDGAPPDAAPLDAATD